MLTCQFLLFVFVVIGHHLSLVDGSSNGFANNTFNINGMFSIQTQEGINYQTGVVMAEAFQFAIRQVDEHNPDFLHGYRFKLNEIFDVNDGTTEEITYGVRKTIMDDVPFLVGPFSSETSYVTSILSGIFKQFVLSYGATYSDFHESIDSKNNMVLRSVPSNIFRSKALHSVVKEFRWNYISIISSYGYDGERDIRYFTGELDNSKVCIGSSHALPHHPTDFQYADVLNTTAKDERAKVLLLFTNIKDSKNIIKAIAANAHQGRFQLLCVFGCTNYKEVIEGYEETAAGVLDLDLHVGENKDFEKYFLSQNPQTNKNKYFINFWENYFNCSTKRNVNAVIKRAGCTGDERFKAGDTLYKNTPVHTVIDAVYAIASATRVLIQRHCGTETRNGSLSCYINAVDRSKYNKKFYNIMLNATFEDRTVDIRKAFRNARHTGDGFINFRNISHDDVQYDVHYYGRGENGVYKNLLVGYWSIKRENLSFFNLRRKLNSNVPTLRFFRSHKTILRNITGISCSLPCPPGYHRSPDSNIVKSACCWSCSPCPDQYVSVNESCVQCAETEHVKNNKCEMLPQRYLQFGSGNALAIVFSILSVAGFMSVAAVASILIRFNNHKMVRASGRDLFYIMLVGTFLTFVCPFTMLVRPSGFTCVSRGILPGLAFLTCYAPLFLKTNRIHRIFNNGKKSVSPPALISPQSQILILLAITSIQILLSSVWFVSKSPEPILVVSPDRSHTVLKCTGDASPILILLNLAMSVMFMISCTVLAFKTRRFPKNFNEAKDIGVTLYVTCVVWSVFLPAYFLVLPWSVEFIREYLMSAVSIVIGYTSLFGLFGRKLKILLTTAHEPAFQRKSGPPERENRYSSFVSSIQDNASSIYKQACPIVKSPDSSLRMIENGKTYRLENNNGIEASESYSADE